MSTDAPHSASARPLVIALVLLVALTAASWGLAHLALGRASMPVALAVASLQHYARIRSDEAELLRIGAEYRGALAAYRDAHPSRAYPAATSADCLPETPLQVQRRARGFLSPRQRIASEVVG